MEAARHVQTDMLLKMMERSSLVQTSIVRQTKEETPKLTKFTKSDDIEEWLKTFERMMTAFQVEKKLWPFKLAPQLTGKAQKAYAALDSTRATDYDSVKPAILHRYDITEETYRQRLRSRKKGEEESYCELATRQMDLCIKWTQGCKSVEEMREMVAVEQFTASLPRDMQIWLKERKLKTILDAGRLVDDYINARKATSAGTWSGIGGEKAGSRRCHVCGKMGQLVKDCLAKPKGVSSVKSSACTSSSGATGSSLPRFQAGHSQTQTGRRPLSNIICFKCKERGHIALRCPKNALVVEESDEEGGEKHGEVVEIVVRGEVDEREVDDILVDTGCARNLVRKSLVVPSKLTGGEVSVRCAHGDVSRYPIAEVKITIQGESRCCREAATICSSWSRCPSNIPVAAANEVQCGQFCDDTGTSSEGAAGGRTACDENAGTANSSYRR